MKTRQPTKTLTVSPTTHMQFMIAKAKLGEHSADSLVNMLLQYQSQKEMEKQKGVFPTKSFCEVSS